jgi:monovalent cation/hydrogen antiporter
MASNRSVNARVEAAMDLRPKPCADRPSAPSGAERLAIVHRGDECEHFCRLEEIAKPRADRCEECGIERRLRVCLTCGHVGCCDSAHGHARDHAAQAGHLLIRAWKGGGFVYCFEHLYL